MTVHWKGGLAQLVCILYNKDLHRHKVSLLMLLSQSQNAVLKALHTSM